MALKDTWVDLEDAIEGAPDSGDEVSAEPINRIAHAVISLENNGGGGGTGEPGKSPYIGDNGNWYEYDGTKYVDTGVQAKGEDGKSGLPNVKIWKDEDLRTEIDPFPAYTEIRLKGASSYFWINSFARNTENPNVDMWAISLAFRNNEDGYAPSIAFPDYVEWAVADPVFTVGYTYYLSFIPLVDEGVDEYGRFKGKILGIWVAKELS